MSSAILLSTEVDAKVDQFSPDILVMARGEPRLRLTKVAAKYLGERLLAAYNESANRPNPPPRDMSKTASKRKS